MTTTVPTPYVQRRFDVASKKRPAVSNVSIGSFRLGFAATRKLLTNHPIRAAKDRRLSR